MRRSARTHDLCVSSCWALRGLSSWAVISLELPKLTSTARSLTLLPGSTLRGSAIARLAGINAQKYPDQFEQRVSMWVFEEDYEGKKLTEVINTEHENKKYLPDIKLPENVVAVPDIVDAVKGATAIVFVTPHQVRSLIRPTPGDLRTSSPSPLSSVRTDHPSFPPLPVSNRQFLGKLMSQLKDKIPEGVKAVSAIKVRLLFFSPLPLELALTGHGVSPQRVCAGCRCQGWRHPHLCGRYREGAWSQVRTSLVFPFRFCCGRGLGLT